MDYEKKYKEALERARKSYVNSIEQGWTCDKAIYEEIFPEFKECEDDKWRKWLIGHLEGYINITDNKYAEVCKKAIAWLEKQSQTFTKKDVDDAYLKGVCDAKHELEKQSEQKPIPKFKVGDKVLWKYNKSIVRTIVKVSDYGTYWIECEGCSSGWWSEQELEPYVSQDEQKPIIFHYLTEEQNPRSYCGVDTSGHFQVNDENGEF